MQPALSRAYSDSRFVIWFDQRDRFLAESDWKMTAPAGKMRKKPRQ